MKKDYSKAKEAKRRLNNTFGSEGLNEIKLRI